MGYNYFDQLKLIKQAQKEMQGHGMNLATELEARAAGGHVYLDTNVGRIDINLLRKQHNNADDWIARTLKEAANTPDESKADEPHAKGTTVAPLTGADVAAAGAATAAEVNKEAGDRGESGERIDGENS